ncbi:MAG: cell division protein FtsQ/DivIB [Acidimicrobiales bacterium]
MSDTPTGRPPGTVLEQDPPRATVPVPDPRLRARRIEVRRTEGRRRLRRLLIALGVTAACVVAWGLTRSPLLDVDHIEVTGTQALSAAEVVSASGIDTGDALVDLDLGAATDAVSALPWIESAQVHRRWSGTVEVVVVERRPVAVLTVPAGGSWLVDDEAWVIAETDAAEWPGLPRLDVELEPRPGAVLDGTARLGVQVATMLTVGMAPDVDAVEIVDGELWLRLVPGAGDVDLATLPSVPPARVRLGDGRDLADQMVAAETVMRRVDLACAAVVDVRVASSPVVTRHPECAG